jgi:hypothetical protein
VAASSATLAPTYHNTSVTSQKHVILKQQTVLTKRILEVYVELLKLPISFSIADPLTEVMVD